MRSNYSEEEIKLAKNLLLEYDYTPALHKFIQQTSKSYKEADMLFQMIQNKEI